MIDLIGINLRIEDVSEPYLNTIYRTHSKIAELLTILIDNLRNKHGSTETISIQELLGEFVWRAYDGIERDVGKATDAANTMRDLIERYQNDGNYEEAKNIITEIYSVDNRFPV